MAYLRASLKDANAKLAARFFAQVLLFMLCFGCGVGDQRTTNTASAGTKQAALGEIELAAVAKPKKKVTVDIGDGQCTATYEEHTDGTLKKDTLKITSNPAGNCTLDKIDGPLTITVNGVPVKDIGPAQIIFQGSCRYCYINSVGGMNCVVYNVLSCP